MYTNGTLVDPQLLRDDEAGHCIAICEDEQDLPDGCKKFGVCVLDCSTSQFNLSALDDDVCRTKLETLFRQVRPKEILFTKVCPISNILWFEPYENRQGALSVSTTRLLKNVLPSECLWTGLRTVEGFNHKQTISELRKLYDDDDSMEDDDGCALPSSVPEQIREMLSSTLAAQALGTMIWWVRHGHQ